MLMFLKIASLWRRHESPSHSQVKYQSTNRKGMVIPSTGAPALTKVEWFASKATAYCTAAAESDALTQPIAQVLV